MKSLRSLGPAIIVAAVVCGPGSILSASKVGASFGYSMTWAVMLAVALMIGATSLAARVGVGYRDTPCEELSNRLGRGAGLALGVVIFIVCAGFQASNNLAVALVGDDFLGGHGLLAATVLTAALILVVLRAPNLYAVVERTMKALVLLMVLAFLASFLASKPSMPDAVSGLVPRMPDAKSGGFLAVVGLMATTFSIAGAFYQAYLVRDRGWGPDDVRAGARDSIIGILILGAITLVIVFTAAATFFGTEPKTELRSVTDLARQFEAVFGQWARPVFGVGLLAGALSSFLVNAMIGGQFLADGLGRGRDMGSGGARWATVAALLVGYLGCLAGRTTNFDPVTLILIAQASTVLGGPLLAGTLLWLGTRRSLHAAARPPRWVIALGALGFLVTLVLSWKTISQKFLPMIFG